MQYAKAIIISSHIPVLATVVYAGLLYRSLTKPLQTFAWFIFLSGAIQFTSLLLWFGHRNNLPLVHIYVPAGFACLAWFYRTALGDFIRPGIIWSACILFLLFSTINTALVQPIFIFNSNALVFESILIVILSVFTFLFFLNHSVQEAGIRDIKSLTWINSGLFVYFLSCLLIYYISNLTIIDSSSAMRRYPWIFHSFFSVVMYTCFLVGLWKRSRTQH